MSDAVAESLVASLEATAIVSVDAGEQRSRKRGPTALQTFLGKLVPLILISYIAAASRLVLVDALPLWPPIPRETLRWSFSINLIALLSLFIWLCTRPRTHARPPAQPNEQTIFECGRTGEHLTCEWCEGRPWLPARARHCRECQSCVTGFDHHCACRAIRS